MKLSTFLLSAIISIFCCASLKLLLPNISQLAYFATSVSITLLILVFVDILHTLKDLLTTLKRK